MEGRARPQGQGDRHQENHHGGSRCRVARRWPEGAGGRMTNAKRAGTGDADPLLKVDSGDLLSASSDEIATQADARTAPISIDRCVRLDDICIAPDRTSPL